jgi:hypothetical protein
MLDGGLKGFTAIQLKRLVRDQCGAKTLIQARQLALELRQRRITRSE